MGTLMMEVLDEGVELGLLLQDVLGGRSGGFLLERQVHAFMAPVLLGVAGTNAFDADAQAQPPDGKFGEIEQSIRRSKGNAIVGTDGLRQTPFFEKTLKAQKSRLFAIGFQGLAQ